MFPFIQCTGPRIIVSPTSQRVSQISPLRMTCIAYLGNETQQQPTSLTWYNEVNEVITNSTQVNIYNSTVVRRGHVFMESILEACIVYPNLIGQLSCGVSNVEGQDSARWNITYNNNCTPESPCPPPSKCNFHAAVCITTTGTCFHV